MEERIYEEPLLYWLQTFHTDFPESLASAEDVAGGHLLVRILQEIYKKPFNGKLLQNTNDSNARLHNLLLIYKQIISFYTDSLKQVVLLDPPDLIAVSEDPLLVDSLPKLRQLLLLLLGCVTQAPRKDEYISVMETLPASVQSDIMLCFQELNRQTMSLEAASTLGDETAVDLFRSTLQVVAKREKLFEDLCLRTMERNYMSALLIPSSKSQTPHPPASLSTATLASMSAAAESHSSLVNLSSEVEEKTRLVNTLRQQLKVSESMTNRLRGENSQLSKEARAVDSNEQQLRELKEKLQQSEKLESEMYRMRQQLNEMEFYKTRVQELREDNSTLIEEKQRVEDLLSSSRRKEEDVIERLVECQLRLDESLSDRTNDRRQIQELMDRVTELESDLRHAKNKAADSVADLYAATEATRIGVSLGDEIEAGRVGELEREVEALKGRLVEAERLAEQREDKWKVLEMQKEKVAARREVKETQQKLEAERRKMKEFDGKFSVMMREKENLLAEIATMKAGHEEHAMELEERIQDLTKQVMVLRRKGAQLAGAQFREMELNEMELMYKSVQELSTQMSRVKNNNKVLRKSCDRLKEDVDKIVTIEEENERLKRENRELRRQLISKTTNDEQGEILRKKNLQLEIENKKLRRIIESLRMTLVQIDPSNRMRYHYITSL